MVILFADEELERLCTEEQIGKKKLGADGAKKLRTRLADLAAVANVRQLCAGRPHALSGNRAGQYAVDLDGGRRLVFEPVRQPPPMLAAGGIDWAQVTEIRIVYIGDYHD